MESDYLFVYGTLLKDFESYMSKFLELNSEFISTGYFHGNLYQISWYPGAVLSNNALDKVYGHIFKVLNAKKTFKILDDYEGVGNTGEYVNEYKRSLTEVYLDSNEAITSWVYIYNLPTTQLKHIPTGKYV